MKEEASKIQVIERRKILADARVWFLKVINGNESKNPFPWEVCVTSAKAGENTGGHYFLIV